MDNKKNPDADDENKKKFEDLENQKFPNTNFGKSQKQHQTHPIQRKYISESASQLSIKKAETSERGASDLLKSTEDFKEQIQKIRSELRRFDKEYEENVKKDPIYHHLSQVSDLTIADDELAQRIYKNKIKEYKGAREGARKTGDMVGRGRKVYLKVFGEDENQRTESRAEPDSRYQPKRASLQNQTRTIEQIYSRSRQDIEAWLGENLLGKVGIVMLVVGIIMLINFGIDAGYIGNIGQLFIGFTAGGGLVYLSHRMRNQNPTISGSILIGGMIVLYYSANLLFEYYSLGSQLWAYAINLLITSIAAVLALAHGRKNLALVSIIGGYITAYFVVVSFETTNYLAVFAYLLLLNMIALGIAYRKEWEIINIFTFVASLVLFDGWVFFNELTEGNNAFTALVFATLYYITFFLMNIVYSMGTRQRLKGFNYTMLLANVISYVLVITYVLYQIDSLDYLGGFIFGLAVFNSFYSYQLYKSDSADVRLFYTVVGYTIFFFTIAIPLLVDKEYINVCFVFEGVALLWVGVRSQMSVFKTASLALIGLSMIVWFFDLYWAYENELTRRFLLNGAVLSSLLTMVGLAFSIYLLKDEDDEEEISFITVGMYTNFLGGFMLLIFLVIGNLELIIHKVSNFGSQDFRLILIGLFNIIYAVGVWQFSKIAKWNGVQQIMSGMIFLMTFIYFGLVQPQAMDLLLEHIRTKSSESHWLTNSFALSQYLGHYLNVFITLLGLFLLTRDGYYEDGERSIVFATSIYMLCFAVVAYSSLELRNTVIWLFYDLGDDKEAILNTNSQFGYAILWAILSISAISLGLRYKLKEVRLFALFLFVVLLAKFFFWDFWQMGTIEGIVSFVIIGIILLRIGWKYNQIKKLVMEGELQEVYQNTGETELERDTPTGVISSQRRPSREARNRGVEMSREDREKENDELADLPPPPKPRPTDAQRPPSQEKAPNRMDEPDHDEEE